MKAIYVAHPLRGDVENNIRKVTEICRRIAATGRVVVFSPIHAFPGFMDINGDQTYAMKCCLRLLAAADELWIFGRWTTSEGCMSEFRGAAERRQTIRIFSGEEDDSWMEHLD
jgi:hypothetical protein